MELQPNLVGVNTLPLVFASRSAEPEPEVTREQAQATPVKPIVEGFFVSPLLQFDNQALALIFQVRDSESGEVQRQFPSQSAIERLRSNPEVRTIEIPDAVVGAGSSEAETDTVGVVGGMEVSNGAPAIGGTSSGVSPALAPSGQSVNFLV